MSSSRLVENRKKLEIPRWYDTYLRPFNKCHPDFDTIALDGDPRKLKMCVRRNYYESNQNETQGVSLWRYNRKLYERSNVPTNTSCYHYPPNESYSIINDYYKLDKDFDGTGVYRGRVCKGLYEFAYD